MPRFLAISFLTVSASLWAAIPQPADIAPKYVTTPCLPFLLRYEELNDGRALPIRDQDLRWLAGHFIAVETMADMGMGILSPDGTVAAASFALSDAELTKMTPDEADAAIESSSGLTLIPLGPTIQAPTDIKQLSAGITPIQFEALDPELQEPPLYLIQFSPHGGLVATVSENVNQRIHLYPYPFGSTPPQTLSPASVIISPQLRITELAISPDETLLAAASGTNDGILLWNISDPSRPEPLWQLGHLPQIGSKSPLSLDEQNRRHTRFATPEPETSGTAFGHEPGDREFYGVPKGKKKKPKGPSDFVKAAREQYHAIAFSPSGRYLAASSGQLGRIRAWDLQDEYRELEIPEAFGRQLLFVSETEIFCAGGKISEHKKKRDEEAPALFLDILKKERREIEVPEGTVGWVGAIAISPDLKSVAAGFDNLFAVWSVQTGKLSFVGRGSEGPILSGPVYLSFSPGGNYLLSVGSNHQIILWDLVQKQPVYYLVALKDEAKKTLRAQRAQ